MSKPNWTGTGVLENPCYDRKTETSCPRRCEGCQINCPEWKAYLVKRDEMYKNRQIKYEARSVVEEQRNQLATKSLKKKQSLRRIHR